jgi:hypothetical protein
MVRVYHLWCRSNVEARYINLCYAVCPTAPLAVACSCLSQHLYPVRSFKGDAPKTAQSSFVCAPCSGEGACQATFCESWALCKT